MYIVWRGSDKSPVNALHPDPASDFARVTAQDRSAWLSYDVAAAYAKSLGPGYGVGVVLHPEAKLMCIDFDGCLVDGVLSPLAKEIIRKAFAAFPETYVEISMSGRGVHVIAPYDGEPPPHSTKNLECHFELYHERRYIALTGDMIKADDARLN